MKIQTSDENMKFLLKEFQIQHPKRKCPSGNQIANICLNHSCPSNAIYCEQQDCNSCSKAHIICQHIYLRSFTYLLQKRAQGQKQFMIKVFEIQNQMIQEIQRRRKAIVQKFYLGDLQEKYLKVIEGLYVKKQQNFQLKSQLADQTYGVLRRLIKEVVGQDRQQLLSAFKVQVQTVIKSLQDAQAKLIGSYIKKSKIRSETNLIQGSTIITKDNKEFLQFLQQSFLGARKFKLIFRASQHTFQAAKFHQYCDNIKNTFTLIKTQFGKTIGGYTPLKWNEIQGTGFVADKQGLSFILSFNLRQKMKLVDNDKAIYNAANYGPIFGNGHDFYIVNKCNQSNCVGNFAKSYNCNGMYSQNQQTYTAFVGATNSNYFKVPEYEVYQVFW